MTPINHYEGDRDRALRLQQELVKLQWEMLALLGKHPELRKEYAGKVEECIKKKV